MAIRHYTSDMGKPIMNCMMFIASVIIYGILPSGSGIDGTPITPRI